jgi:hypothetical protein
MMASNVVPYRYGMGVKFDEGGGVGTLVCMVPVQYLCDVSDVGFRVEVQFS